MKTLYMIAGTMGAGKTNCPAVCFWMATGAGMQVLFR